MQIDKKEDIENKKFRSYRATYSLGEKLYELYIVMISNLNDFCAGVLAKDVDSITPFYAGLRTYYINVKILISNRQQFNDKMIDIKREFKLWDTKRKTNPMVFPDDLSEKLVDFYEFLSETLQLGGLGIEIQKEMSKKKEIRKALGLIK